MTPTTLQRLTFEEYLTYDDGTDNRYELVNGELVLMPPPIGQHAGILELVQISLYSEIKRLGQPWSVRPGNVGVRTTENKSRIPDLVVITEAQRRAIRSMSAVVQSPPLLAIEIVSEGNPATDYRYKRSEYAAREIPEYWIIDPLELKVTVLLLINGLYEETVFTGTQQVISRTFPDLLLIADQILQAGAD
jgi:Uma2 family endonuclease